ncbi:phage tail tip lysozyme [Paraburkholderia unamae]|uniref:Phage tail lysozyme domain-containing protein n=1 Tax=Paraburkholderia unamae TaxID=219649 RepID=A0ABX5K6R9_9BURK|nr:phage tail tip lysozyme [Paraburkholderia unamae]PVX61233.1 hypothetical protein C7402_14224 [Paraburkholderia unamae]
MASVIDALVVTLGLDISGFISGKSKAAQATKQLSAEEAKAQKELEARNKQAAESFKKVRNEVLALLAVFTAGMGIKDFTEHTIGSAVNLGYMAKNLQMSTRELSSWQRAAERAGGSAEGITSALQDSQQQIAKFRLGQVSESIQWFLRFGGKTSDLKDGNSYLLARAKIVQDLFKVDPGRARFVAQQMGISDEEFNFIKQGPQAILALVSAQEKNAAITEKQAAAALKLQNAWLDLRDRLVYVGTTVLLELMPTFELWLQKLQKMADWVADHRGDIVQWVNDAVKAIQQFVQWADKAADSVGGWKNVLIALAALKVLSMSSGLLSLAAALIQVGGALGGISTAGVAALPVLARLLGIAGLALHSEGLNSGEDAYLQLHGAQPGQTWTGDAGGDARRAADSGSTSDRANYLMARLKAAGYTDAQAAGIVGSLMQEAQGLNPAAVNPKSGAAGIGQWLGSRAAAFQQQFGHSLAQSTFGEQVDFMLQELKTSERDADMRIRNATTPEQAAYLHSQFYERPGAAEANIARRQAYARDIYSSIGQANAAQIAGQSSGVRGGSYASRVSTMTSTAETNINGPITIHTQATDAQGIAREFGKAVGKYSFTVPQANTGLT